MPLDRFVVHERGSGDEQYHSPMLLALLLYCYSPGLFSSRRIEKASWSDVAVRYICANRHPDHDTSCTFRVRNWAAIEDALGAPAVVLADKGYANEAPIRELQARSMTVLVPLFGIIKQVLGFRQFLLRGLGKVELEWLLVTCAYNLKRVAALHPIA